MAGVMRTWVSRADGAAGAGAQELRQYDHAKSGAVGLRAELRLPRGDDSRGDLDVMRSRFSDHTRLLAFVALVSAAAAPAWAGPSDPWLDRVAHFVAGGSSGFGADKMPGVVFGPPVGGGLTAQSTDVVSLGNGGTITVVFRDNVVFDGPGNDLAIYENAFHAGSETGPIFTEYASIELSPDGKTWTPVPYDALTGDGLAGGAAVLSAPDNGIDPVAPEGGGDRFDIGAVGLSFVRFVRITDGGDAIEDAGNSVPSADKGGFDLDAAAAIHSTAPGFVHGTITAGGVPVPDARVKIVPADGTRRLYRRSQADGSYRFRPVLPSGEIMIKARRLGVGVAVKYATVTMDSLDVEADLELE